MSDQARLFRMPVTFTGQLESVPPPPEGPALFSLSDAITKVEIGMVISGMDQHTMRDRGTVTVNLTAMRDEQGAVLSAGFKLTDSDGKPLEMFSLMVDQADAERIGQAIAALFNLTPKPGETA